MIPFLLALVLLAPGPSSAPETPAPKPVNCSDNFYTMVNECVTLQYQDNVEDLRGTK